MPTSSAFQREEARRLGVEGEGSPAARAARRSSPRSRPRSSTSRSRASARARSSEAATFFARLWKSSRLNSSRSRRCRVARGPIDSKPGSSGTSVSIVTSSRDRSSCSRSRSIFSRILPLTSSRCSSTPCTEPNSAISLMAPFSPMPLTPGTLSEASPMIASTSITCSGVVPNFSSTAARLAGRGPRLRLEDVVELHLRLAHELHEVLVAGDDVDLKSGCLPALGRASR